ncbi:hypothetical protein RJ47_13980 [Vibrio sinaloensis]|nr:hypothetical protein RJ47_13980 [Vibrio sinaloensis]
MFSFFKTDKAPKLKAKKFEIEPKMVNSDVYRIDMKSLRNSKAVKKQLRAAEASFEREKATA